MATDDRKQAKAIFFIILVILGIFALVFFLLFFIFGPSFVLKYSPDGSLKDSTIAKINILKNAFLFIGLFIAFSAFMIYTKRKISINFFDRHKNIFTNILLLFFTIVFFLLFIEFTLSFIVGDETSFTSAGPGSINFYKENVQLNNEGFRDDNFSIEKNNETFRIAVVGDSLAFGSGVANVNNTFPRLIEEGINKDSKVNYEVYNFGIPGYDIRDELNVIKNKVRVYNPDLIIIEYYENDIENIDQKLIGFETIDTIQLPYFGFWLRQFSYTYYFAESRINKIAENVGIKRKWLDTLNKTYSSEVNRKYNKELYRNISGEIDRDNASVLLVAFPVISNFTDYQFYIVNDFAKELAEDNGFYFLDLKDDFNNYTSAELSVNKYDYHPNELGHRVAADAIIRKLINSKIV